MSGYAAESERLWLQALSKDEHLDDYYQIMSNPQSMLWSTGRIHTDIKETEQLILESHPTFEKPWNIRYAILLRPDPRISKPEENQRPKMIGVVGTPRESEVAYKMHPEYWGKGYMSEALAMFIKLYWTFEGQSPYPMKKCVVQMLIREAVGNLNAHLLAHADPENDASNRVLEKAGFQKGEVRRCFYERAILNGVKKSDLQSYYLERPKN